MGHAACSDNKKEGMRKGAWSAEEDQKLVSFIRRNNGHGSWRTLPDLAGLQRCGKSCRLRWTNYLRPNIKHGNFTPDEEWRIMQLHAVLGNKWSTIALRLPGRTDNEVKNHWNTHLKKQLFRMGIHPTMHRPASAPSLVNLNKINRRHKTHTKALPRVSLPDQSYVSHMAQWELARLEAEARQTPGKTSVSSDGLKHADAWRAGTSQGSTDHSRSAHGKTNELLESILMELMEAPSAAAPGVHCSADRSNSSSSAGSQFNMNEADITSPLTPLINIMRAPSGPCSPYRHHDPLLPLLPVCAFPAPCEAISDINYWATMLSLVGPVISSCPASRFECEIETPLPLG